MNRPSKAQISRTAIERIYIAMRHLFIRGGYKPLGKSGEAMINALLALEPEIYGSIADEERVELNGLLYVFQRLPKGIEECRYIHLISREGFEDSNFEAIVPDKRRRNCYRIDDNQMFIEMTRGRSDIYDVLTHLTFLYIEAEKIRKNALDSREQPNRSWQVLEDAVLQEDENTKWEVVTSHVSMLVGRTYAETKAICDKFDLEKGLNTFYHIIYHLGKLSMNEYFNKLDREITFSSNLRNQVGHHIYGEKWATNIKKYIYEQGWQDRKVHVISANLHSVINTLFAAKALPKFGDKGLLDIAAHLSNDRHHADMEKVKSYAEKNGVHRIHDDTGTNIGSQIIDTARVPDCTFEQILEVKKPQGKSPIIIVMDYAFGEQAYEVMDELLKPLDIGNTKQYFDVASINIMGKAGILEGTKGDIMVPDAHVFEGTADNYPIENAFDASVFQGTNLHVYHGSMITVLGTSLQNKDVLRYFLKSSWKACGLEMEGAHYQKAIQAASKIRNSINREVTLRYAYYASDNPLETGSTLASGGLGLGGVQPTYLITLSILRAIFK